MRFTRTNAARSWRPSPALSSATQRVSRFWSARFPSKKSEELSKILKAKGIKHTVLNAKYHEREAEIVAQAGKPGAVTIATNMAGRGTDIMLGGNAETMALDEIKKYLRHEVEDRVQKGRDGRARCA